MKTCFPARKADGKEYASLDEMMAHIGKEAHGFWLAGLSGRWHGGIHITDESAPGSVMNSETAETAVPLPFMVGGEVVAWRIGKDYVTSEYMDTVPQFSSTFVLVKSVCTPEAEKPDNSLEFYTLYMGLAPLSVFPRYKQYQVAEKVTRLVRRRYTGQEKEGDTIPADTGKRLKAGDRVMVIRECRFMTLSNKTSNKNAPEAGKAPEADSRIKVLRKNSAESDTLLPLSGQIRTLADKNAADSGNPVRVLREKRAEPEVPPQIFGLARLLNDKDEMTGDAFWVTIAPEYMTLVGEAPAGLPAWMREAVSHDVYDQVVMPVKKISVQAREAVGFLGEDISPAGGGKVKIRSFIHIEVISTDSRLEDFLNNKAEVRSGGKYIHIHPDSELYMRSGDSFTKNGGTVRKDIHKVLPQSQYQEFTDNEGKRWFDIGNGKGPWLSGADVDADISQYDLAKRGFCVFEEGTTEDMAISLNEAWVKQAMEHFAGAVIPARGIREKLVSNYYKTLVDRIDTDHNGRLSVDEILRAMTYPELDIQDIAARLVIKHDSEWYGGSQHQKWEKVLKNCDSLRVKYVNKWLDSMEWMSHVPPFDKGEPIWHMHPVMFLDALKEKADFSDTIDFQTTLGVYRISKKAADLILKAEGYQKYPYVPKGSNASGITIGYGYDLGQQTVYEMRSMLSDYFSEEQLARLEKVIGLTGDNASALTPTLADITISKENAVSLAMKMKSEYAQIVVNTYPEVLNTHPHCQGAMLSLVINRGTSFSKPNVESRIEMKKIHDDFVSGNLSDIPNQFRSMKRIWIGKGLDGLIFRREDEAKLFEEGLSQ